MKECCNENTSLVKQMIHLVMTHKKVFDRHVCKSGLYRSQHQLLMHISKHEGQTQTEIAKALEVSKATIAISVKKLEKGGYLCKVIDQEDNRNNRIDITEKGQQVIDQTHEIFSMIDNKMLEDFSNEEKEKLSGFLQRMMDNLLQI